MKFLEFSLKIFIELYASYHSPDNSFFFTFQNGKDNYNNEVHNVNGSKREPSVNPERYHSMYSKESQDNINKPRSKRKASLKRACSLYIQTDPLLWEHIFEKENDEAKTREEIVALIDQHVKAVNHIYESEDFGGYRGIKFIVQRITVSMVLNND